ncbi:hypothetical protein IQ230_20630 [Gloeocapsopsis crepidinum LEGE 06123]|uniref:Uncharacterized protein n=1 Tax=Gloeocapsopsis crepidinum LEGE 06123 TaxID=588587 RepID=A0ABR9UWN7_9CHRO|nr:hypothetical protein [Gloeocapsopsis crepidinum]MBE9192712.1 hypothetical protein [Gloeocapsopsis crepidinum LEGE 06123]
MSRRQQFINQIPWDSLLLVVITCLSLVYLVAIPFNWIRTRLKLEELILFTVILLVNSQLLERLRKLGINKDGISFELDQIQAEQKTQRDSIEINRANIDAITNITQRLTLIESELADSKTETQFLNKSLLNDDELEHLYKLASNDSFSYEKEPRFIEQIRHLRALGFIKTIPGKTIFYMPKQGNLRDYFRITEQGKNYLKKMNSCSVTNRNN